MGRGGALLASGSVTPGIDGIRGGSERALAELASAADKRAFESIVDKERMIEEDLRGFEQVLSLLLSLSGSLCPYL